MKIVQTLWTKPLFPNSEEGLDNREVGGWPDMRHYLMSIAFSSLQLMKYYDRVELITDYKGKNLIVDRLKLPYSRVTVELDKLNGYSAQLWNLGKIYSYGLQDEPFLHVDNDAYIWQRFGDRIENAGLVVQNNEIGYDFYSGVFESVKDSFNFIPECILEYEKRAKSIDACNLGVVGGNLHLFFHNYAKAFFHFLDSSQGYCDTISMSRFSIFCEQVLFCCMAHFDDIEVVPLFSIVDEQEVERQVQSVKNFSGAPRRAKFIHLYGNSKKNIRHCRELEVHMRRLYPDYYNRIMEMSGAVMTDTVQRIA